MTSQACVGYARAVGTMVLDEVADLGVQADATVTTMADHSWQLGELSVMMQMMQEMLGAQQECLMRTEVALRGWAECLVVQETTVNECLMWLRDQVTAMDVDEEEEEEEEEATTSMEVDKGSPVVLDSDLDNFGSPELRPTLVRWGSMGGLVLPPNNIYKCGPPSLMSNPLSWVGGQVRSTVLDSTRSVGKAHHR